MGEALRTRDIDGTGRGTDAARLTLVVGLGATGLSVAEHLAARGEAFRIVDSRETPPALAELSARLPGAEVELGRLDVAALERIDRVVVSPGLALDLPLLREAHARGLPVVSDIELFARAAQAPVLAVTGSNGKSSVVTMLARMLEHAGYAAPVGGNLGPPALTLLERPQADAYVLEISSFQMETTESLKPRAAAVLNVSADHLDRHGTLERYAALKAKLLESAERGVYNLDDTLVRAMGERHPQAIAFSTATPLESGYSIVEHEGAPWLARDRRPLLETAALAQQGTHNWGNALAALALSDAFGADEAAALEALGRYEGLPHRCERVAEIDGVVYVDDSKGTNVGATIAAVAGMPGPVVLIAGGLAKGADLAALAEHVAAGLKALVVIGEAAPALERAFAGAVPCRRAETMDAAVAAAAAEAEAGDIVLLSPACASFDMFRDYAARGEAFQAAVRARAR